MTIKTQWHSAINVHTHSARRLYVDKHNQSKQQASWFINDHFHKLDQGDYSRAAVGAQCLPGSDCAAGHCDSVEEPIAARLSSSTNLQLMAVQQLHRTIIPLQHDARGFHGVHFAKAIEVKKMFIVILRCHHLTSACHIYKWAVCITGANGTSQKQDDALSKWAQTAVTRSHRSGR